MKNVILKKKFKNITCFKDWMIKCVLINKKENKWTVIWIMFITKNSCLHEL